MTYTEQIKSILEKSGVDTSALPDNLYSTLLNALLNAEMGGGGLTREEVEKIVTDEVSKIVADAPEDFDTLKEMSDWISQHEDSAAAMNSAIQQNATDISTLKNDSHTHTNKTVLDGITQVQLDKITTNETNISTLAKHVTGELTDSDFQEDSMVAMTKTVPSGMSDYAAVKMIGGKTVKTKNLLKPQNDLKEATVNGITFTPVFDSNGHLEYVTANGTATDTAIFIISKLKEDVSGYILSLGLSQESVSYRVACALGISPWTTYQNIIGSGEKTIPSITYTDTIDVYIHVLKDAVANNVKFYPMLRKPGTSGTYEPYHEELWNAPVESVVSTSADGTTKTTLLVPEAIKNLPDYGVEGNVVDFENGTYTHTNTTTDGEVTALSISEIINISDMLMPIRVVTGGTITLQNEHSLDMPNSIMYKKEVSLNG